MADAREVIHEVLRNEDPDPHMWSPADAAVNVLAALSSQGFLLIRAGNLDADTKARAVDAGAKAIYWNSREDDPDEWYGEHRETAQVAIDAALAVLSEACGVPPTAQVPGRNPPSPEDGR